MIPRYKARNQADDNTRRRGQLQAKINKRSALTANKTRTAEHGSKTAGATIR